jgi:hypothetical protein
MSDKSNQKNKIIHGKYIQSLDAQLNNERDIFLWLTKEYLMDTLICDLFYIQWFVNLFPNLYLDPLESEIN